MTLFSRVFLGLLLLASSGLPAVGDTFLDQLSGTWTGGGWEKRNLDAVREALRCDFAFVAKDRAELLSISGRCAGGGKRNDIWAEIRSLGGGRYRASWMDAGRKFEDMAGLLDGRALTFTWRIFDKDSGGAVSGDFNLELSGGSLILRTGQNHPGAGELGRLQLQRR
ncbi:hypothetical protein [Roseibium sp.]|uniref:hypothetical protein n=1 Tax=Roseibium sp. TaxID=1936156 RepID=UPI003D11CCC8